MHFTIHLKTSKFDILREDENPINPIYGQSLLLWIQDQLKDKYEFTTVDYEDWGWYCDIIFQTRTYMLGSSAFYEEGDDTNAELEWVFQVQKQRSFKEVLFFQEKMTAQDDCLQFFQAFFTKFDAIKILSSEAIA
ncbi:hypothetical protein [uncultured Microbulbifer sp.]|uniref:hypothetical protein n=1 Tax=uncultured Microbulbifer sp. TaxID=348147 RepID=UPI0026234721|nr:hypothetical protein [uncultured Microbulbifer sp.]